MGRTDDKSACGEIKSDKPMNQVEAGIAIAREAASLMKYLQPFESEVLSFRIDHINKSSEIKYLLSIPTGIQRTTRRKIEIPATSGFRVYEMWDLDQIKKVDSIWEFDQGNNKWVLDPKKLPNSDRYWLTMKGNVSKEFLDKLVTVKTAENPTVEKGVEKYWLHSAIRDVRLLETIWKDLNIERVNLDVRIGVERFFTSAVPKEVIKRLQIQRELLDAIASGDRSREERLKFAYRAFPRSSRITPQELYNLIQRLVSGEFFSSFVHVTPPFVIGSIEPITQPTVLVPEKVKVGAQTDLGFNLPVVKGDLNFERKQYVESISHEIGESLPVKKKK